MKMSNKILLGTLAIIFIVPVLLAMTLKDKIDKGIYTVEKNENHKESGPGQQGTFAAYKYIKISAPSPQLLECTLKQSDTNSFSYVTDGTQDSVAVFSVNDTLYIQYIGASENESENEGGYGKIKLNISLPAVTHLDVDGAIVILQSPFAAQSALTVSLKNQGMIKDETKVEKSVETEKEDSGKNEKEGFDEEDDSKVLAVLPKTNKIINPQIKEVLIYHLL